MPPNRRCAHRNHSGSVIVYILIGVALCGLLFFAISRGMNSSTAIMSKGSAKTQAQALIDYSQTLQAGVEKLIRRGCSENEISFENSVVSGYSNPNSPASGDRHCWLFDPQGANLTFRKSTASTYNWAFPSSMCIRNIGDYGVTCYASGQIRYTDLVAEIYGIPLDVCVQINTMLRVLPTIPVNIGAEDWSNPNKYKGVFYTGFLPDGTDGVSAGCFKGDATYPGYVFYNVLLARGG